MAGATHSVICPIVAPSSMPNSFHLAQDFHMQRPVALRMTNDSLALFQPIITSLYLLPTSLLGHLKVFKFL